MVDKLEAKHLYETLAGGRVDLPNGCRVGWYSISSYRTVGCPECTDGRTVEDLSFEDAWAWAEAHRCTTPVCKQCHRHVPSHVRMNDEGVCWYCFDYVATLSNGKRVNQTMLRRGFEMVQDKEDWKMPCSGIVKEQELPLVIEAIRWMVGGGAVAEVVNVDKQYRKIYEVTAPGYYLTIGS